MMFEEPDKFEEQTSAYSEKNKSLQPYGFVRMGDFVCFQKFSYLVKCPCFWQLNRVREIICFQMVLYFSVVLCKCCVNWFFFVCTILRKDLRMLKYSADVIILYVPVSNWITANYPISYNLRLKTLKEKLPPFHYWNSYLKSPSPSYS